MNTFLIIGLSQFGAQTARKLSALGAQVLAVDINLEKVDSLASEFDVRQADCLDERTLKGLGVPEYDCVIVSISEDIKVSVLITMMVKDLGAKHIVCQGYDRRHARMLQRLGADQVVCPEADMGDKVAQQLSASGILDYMKLNEHHSLVEIELPASWIGKNLRELNLRASYGVNVIALKNHTQDRIDCNISPDHRFEKNEILMIIGANKDIARLPV